MKVFICGQKTFGREVLKRLYSAGHEITGIAPPPQERLKDKMVGYAQLKGIPVVSDCEKLVSANIPEGTELVVSAHSHWIVSQKILEKCKFGGIGFHPSILPRHRGQDAVRWTKYMGDAITGGTIYRLGERCDAGDILDQRYIMVEPGWDYHTLWRKLFPIGVDMVEDAVRAIEEGRATWTPQNEACATWEPSWERPRLRRNELLMLGGDAGDAVLHEECESCRVDCRWCPHKTGA